MPKLDKRTLALTCKFDCDRFLRFRLASTIERSQLHLEEAEKRPGVQLMTIMGRRWEADKYQDLLSVMERNQVEYNLSSQIDSLVERRTFRPVENLAEVLNRPDPPQAIMEGEFLVPSSTTPSLQVIYNTYHLEPVRARPDIIWIRPALTGAPLIQTDTSSSPEYEIHIVDVKMAAEPSLSHFTEVTFYALALARWLEEEGLSNRYAVSAKGLIWPGSHDANAFRNLVRNAEAQGEHDPVTSALEKTLVEVPYEIYQVHVAQFFEERLPKVLAQEPLEAAWHIGRKCQYCEYMSYCTEIAASTDHLSRIPWLNQGQADLLRKHHIFTTEDLVTAIQNNFPNWQAVTDESQQLRADAGALLVRSLALQPQEDPNVLHSHPLLVEGRHCSLMPAWSNLNIFVTIHFDPGSGITFSMGASRVYFQPNRSPGERPITDQRVFIVDRVENLNPDTERARLIEFIRLVSGWLQEVSDYNETVPARQRLTAHIFFWDTLEVKQLRRMFERHMTHPDVVDLIELLLRLFPPDNILPDPDFFRSQPGTAIKDVLKLVVGLPIPHDYTLLEAANTFYPNALPDGNFYQFRLPFGFETPMNDQIPFERAYELWEDRIYLKRYDPNHPTQPETWPLYTRGEIFQSIQNATITRMRALQHIVSKLREHHRNILTLQKPGFMAAPPSQPNIPESSRSLITFEKLNVTCQELENRQKRSLPVEEREARFISIRGLMPASEDIYEEFLNEIRTEDVRYADRQLIVFTFSPHSRDARFKEGDFLLSLSNEENSLDLDIPWYKHAGLSYQNAEILLEEKPWMQQWMIKAGLGRFLQVELVRLRTTQEPPLLVLSPTNEEMFEFAQEQDLLNLGQPMVLDPIFRDFSTKKVEEVLREVGGPAPRRRRART